MLTLAERTRKAKYNGELRPPGLMELRPDEIKVGDVFYMHEYVSDDSYFEYIAFIRIVEANSESCFGRHGIFDFDYFFGEYRLHRIREVNSYSFNTYCMKTPSERFLLFHDLGLIEDLALEIMVFLGGDVIMSQ